MEGGRREGRGGGSERGEERRERNGRREGGRGEGRKGGEEADRHSYVPYSNLTIFARSTQCLELSSKSAHTR